MTFVATLLHRFKLARILSIINANSVFMTFPREYRQFNFLHNSYLKTVTFQGNDSSFIGSRFKYKKTSKKDDSDDEDDFSDADEDDSKLITGHVTSLRADAVLKAGLGIARNKIETSFYENKLRLNGKKILKKSQKVDVGDELDLIKERNRVNENLLNVSRVVVVSVKGTDEGDKLKIKIKRFKNLTVEDYDQ